MSITLVVIAIALETGDPRALAFERAARGVLGPDATLLLEHVLEDPPDEVSVARGARADGIVELTLSADRARLHCYFPDQARWVDRQIIFESEGEPRAGEAAERGRLLGLAVATMFAGEVDAPSPLARPSPKPSGVFAGPPSRDDTPRRSANSPRRFGLEFAGIASSGIQGTASGLGATAGVRWSFLGPFALRACVAGRAGSIPEAQSTTRTAELGLGVSVRLTPEHSPWLLGLRADAVLSYFAVSHLSEDDLEADEKSRALPGSDLLAEGGIRFTDDLSLHIGAGIQTMFGTTTVYTHERRVAVVPPLRVLGELGVRAGF